MGRSYYYQLMFGIYGGALLFCGALRVYLRFFGIDVVTGFYTASGLPVFAFNAVLGAALGAMLLLNRLRVTAHDYPVLQKSRTSSALALLVGLFIALFMLEATRLKTFTRHSGIRLEGLSAKVCAVLGLLSALAFLWLGLRGTAEARRGLGVVLLVPVIWQTVLLVSKFNDYTTITTISDNLLVILFMVFNCCFIMGHARTVCGFARKDGRNYLLPTGLATSLLGLLLTVPNYLYALLRHTRLPAEALGDMECLYVFVMSLFALAAVRELRKSIVMV